MVVKDIVVGIKSGLHARPCLAILQAVKNFESKVEIAYGRNSAKATDILDLMSLGAVHSAVLTVSAVGPDAESAVDAVALIVEGVE